MQLFIVEKQGEYRTTKAIWLGPDLFLFPKVKLPLCGKHFEMIEVIRKNLQKEREFTNESQTEKNVNVLCLYPSMLIILKRAKQILKK